MRIIAGRLRRRKLLTNPGMTTRPITARVKESLFEHLNPYLVDARVCDVFAGTGTMGLESLSRGAFSAVFIEKDYRAFDLLNQNCDKLGVREEVFCWQTDAVMTSFKPKYCEDMMPYEVVFFDPPYKMVKGIQPGTKFFKTLQRLAKDTITAPDVVVLFRVPKRVEFTLPNCWRVARLLKYSTMDIYWLQKNDAADDSTAATLESEIFDGTELDADEDLDGDEFGDELSDEVDDELDDESGLAEDETTTEVDVGPESDDSVDTENK